MSRATSDKLFLSAKSIGSRRDPGCTRFAIQSSPDIPVRTFARMAGSMIHGLVNQVREMDESGGFDGRLIEQVLQEIGATNVELVEQIALVREDA